MLIIDGDLAAKEFKLQIRQVPRSKLRQETGIAGTAGTADTLRALRGANRTRFESRRASTAIAGAQSMRAWLLPADLRRGDVVD